MNNFFVPKPLVDIGKSKTNSTLGPQEIEINGSCSKLKQIYVTQKK